MQERQREEQWLSQPQQVFVDTRQPWTAQSTTYYMSREEEVGSDSFIAAQVRSREAMNHTRLYQGVPWGLPERQKQQ